MALAGSLGVVAGGGSSGGSSGLSTPLVLNVANAGSQLGSDWTDDTGSLLVTWDAGTTGRVNTSITNAAGVDVLFWDLSALFGEDVLVSAMPSFSLDWLATTAPGEAALLGFGFCAAVNLAGAAVGTNSRWLGMYADGLGEAGVLARRNTDTLAGAAVKASPSVARVVSICMGNKWLETSSYLVHGDAGNPVVVRNSNQNALTSTHKVFAFMCGAPSANAVGEITWKGDLRLNYGGGR